MTPVDIQHRHFDHMLLDKPVDKFLESRRHCCNWQMWLWAQQRRMEQVFIWWRRWFHVFHIIHVHRRLHTRARCHQVNCDSCDSTGTTWSRMASNPDLHIRNAGKASYSYMFLPSLLKSLSQKGKIPPMILARSSPSLSKTFQTDLKRRFFFAMSVPSSLGQKRSTWEEVWPRVPGLSWPAKLKPFMISFTITSQLSNNKCLLFSFFHMWNPGFPVPPAILLAPEKASKLRLVSSFRSWRENDWPCKSFECICLRHCHSFCAFGTELPGTVFAHETIYMGNLRGVQWRLWDNRAAWVARWFCLCGLDVSEPGIGVRDGNSVAERLGARNKKRRTTF